MPMPAQTTFNNPGGPSHFPPNMSNPEYMAPGNIPPMTTLPQHYHMQGSLGPQIRPPPPPVIQQAPGLPTDRTNIPYPNPNQG